MRIGAVLAASVIASLGAGCRDAGPASAGPEHAAASTGATLKVVSSPYGKVVADGKGEALYLFTKDRRGKSRCYGDCAKAWPPFLTRAKPRAGSGVAQSGLGTVRRRDGKLQVTYKGQPLYYYVHDTPGKILCQNVNEFGGDWLVVAPNGNAIR